MNDLVNLVNYLKICPVPRVQGLKAAALRPSFSSKPRPPFAKLEGRAEAGGGRAVPGTCVMSLPGSASISGSLAKQWFQRRPWRWCGKWLPPAGLLAVLLQCAPRQEAPSQVRDELGPRSLPRPPELGPATVGWVFSEGSVEGEALPSRGLAKIRYHLRCRMAPWPAPGKGKEAAGDGCVQWREVIRRAPAERSWEEGLRLSPAPNVQPGFLSQNIQGFGVAGAQYPGSTFPKCLILALRLFEVHLPISCEFRKE